MAHYRIYRLDFAGHIAGVGTNAECANDQEARELAQRMLDGRGQAEVWDRARFVGVVSPASAEDIARLGRSPGQWSA